METTTTSPTPPSRGRGHRGARGNRGSRGNRGNRGRGRGRDPTPGRQLQVQNSAATSSGRTFGGQLTRLDGAAPSFVPPSTSPPPSTTGSENPQSTSQKQKQSRHPKQRQRKASVSRSAAPDIATRIHDDIGHGTYECAVCANEISRYSKVWACHTCWTVFHIGCIKRWSKNESSAVHNRLGENEQSAVGRQWRCPGCNLPKDVQISSYTCWCEKELDPKPTPGLPPHSCGQSCGRERKSPKSCPHPCDLVCHAGPCPPCTAMGPKQSCYCGKEETTRKCLETSYDEGWSCGAICGDVMPCGEHTCSRPCHEGVCGACMEPVDAKCYCGKVEKSIACSEKDEEKESYGWIGYFSCHQTCDRLYDCGVHRCEQSCHPQHAETPHCPNSPDAVLHCPCGKTALDDLKSKPRERCTDIIPSCQEECGKLLACGHCCQQLCHIGDCLPCTRTVNITCRCGRNQFDNFCHYGAMEPPQCRRVCHALLNCGRHECGERCCTGERKAFERQATKRKLKSLAAVTTTRAIDNSIEPEHICTQVCGRPLKCGNHYCPELCHKGPCNTCREAIFDDLACSCGRTVIQAPLPCGTRPPPCTFPCRRPTSCGHPQVAHNCHQDDEECPKCPFLTEKKCLCSKKILKNQPCFRAEVLCGLVCGKTLKCGSHTCRKTCHKPGDCEDAGQHCQQECGKSKKTCGHPCEQPCHAPSSCKENKPCPLKMIVTCDCQRRKEEVRCNVRADVPNPPGRPTSLQCDDECARLERNRNLALALHISDDHTDDHVPYSTATLTAYLQDVAWAHKQEELLRLFAADENEKRYRFKPMKPRQRAFLHSLAEDFGLDSESIDPEPHRHVILFKTPKFVAAPMKTLAQAARLRKSQLNILAPVENVAKKAVKPQFNGFLLARPRFALTEDELWPVVQKAAPNTAFSISFLPNEQGIALIPTAQETDIATTLLTRLQPSLSAEIIKAKLAGTVNLAQFDTTSVDTRVVHVQDTQAAASSGGWSQVAAKKAAPIMTARVAEPVGQRPVYTVLGSRLAQARKDKEKQKGSKRKEEVVDDWEDEVEREEAAGGGVALADANADANAGADADSNADADVKVDDK